MICVLGATGNVGRELVDQLCPLGERVRIVTRDGRKAARWADRVECIVGDLRDPGVRSLALVGASRLFSFPFIEEPEIHAAILDEAKRAGVRHVVALSSIGATSPVPIGRLHREREEAIERSGLHWTFLRPSYFISNVLRWAPAIKRDGRVVTPIPDRKADAISPRDIAEVARLTLVQPGHEGKTYTLTGAELLSTRDQLEILSRVIAKPVACLEVSVAAAANDLRKLGRPEWLVESLVMMWTAARTGVGDDERTHTFAALAGRSPEPFETWCVAHRDAFV
jgi:uncharacterized protein YbjT (DUF2867 family)